MNNQPLLCVNCSETVNTAYCPACGQKNPPKKINALTLYTDFQSRIYGFDGMFPRTLIDLTIRPGKVVKAFVSGNRIAYVGPVGYFFLTITIFLLLASMLDVTFSEFMSAMNSFTGKQSEGQVELSNQIGALMNEYLRLFSFFIALLLVVSTWVFFRRSGFNFLEHAVLVFYNNGHMLWVSIIMLIAYKISGASLNALILLSISMVYYIFTCISTFTYKRKWVIGIRAFFAFIASYFFYILVFSLAFGFYISMHPELLEKFKQSD
jgi:hypothetical protein